MVRLAAYAALLRRYSGQDDLVVGSPIANRHRAETEGLIGFFVNTLALRLDLAGDPTLRQLLAQARQVASGAYAHQDLPFERLVEALSPVRDPSHTPIFQVMLTLQNAPGAALDLPGLALRELELEQETAKLDLSLV